jgi:hypothetical protein
VGGVLVLELIVEGPEAEREARALARLERFEPGDELLPETGRGPVLDRERRALGGGRVLGAVDAPQLVAEEECARGAVPALAQIGEPESERLGELQQPLEVGGAEPERAAVDGAVGEGDPQLVEEDLLAGAVPVEIGGVDDLA